MPSGKRPFFTEQNVTSCLIAEVILFLFGALAEGRFGVVLGCGWGRGVGGAEGQTKNKKEKNKKLEPQKTRRSYLPFMQERQLYDDEAEAIAE